MMSEKRFERWNDYSCKVKDNQEETLLNWEDIVQKLNELSEENEQLRKDKAQLKERLRECRIKMDKFNCR